MKSLSQIILIIVFIANLSSCGSLFNRMSFFPDKIYDLPAKYFPKNSVLAEIKTRDGISLSALYLKNENSGKLVIYFHGNGGNVFHRCNEGDVIRSLGMNVLLTSYRGYGKNGGEPTEEGLYEDGLAACSYAETVLNFKPENIYIYGRSIGTAVAVQSAMNRKYAGVILVSPMTSAADLSEFYGLSFLKCIASGHLENLEKINSISSPLLVMHGTADRVVPFEMGKKIYEAYSGKKRMVTVENADHNNLEYIDPGVYWNEFKLFVSEK